MERKNRNKYERIQFVRDLGFNTEENILIRPKDSVERYKPFLDKLKRCSIRTFKDLEDFTTTPAYPIQSREKAYGIIDNLQKQKYNVILATPIDPANCMFAGAAHKGNRPIRIEIADGPGTTRRVTHEGKIDRDYFLSNKNYWTNDTRVNECVKQIRKCHLKNVIFEFSYYKKPVGYKKENFIVWEICDDGSNQSKV